VETGIIRRRPDGGFVEVHQPLGENLEYRGAPVPKKMNRLGLERPEPERTEAEVVSRT
jgi:ubiquinol-cytochrome c reductase cytochrome b subunit